MRAFVMRISKGRNKWQIGSNDETIGTSKQTWHKRKQTGSHELSFVGGEIKL
jgi:hypothetical protein